jgi:hypothetical protein
VKDWKAIAKVAGLDVSGPELDRLVQALSGLEEAFRPLVAGLTSDVEPATVFHAGETGE